MVKNIVGVIYEDFKVDILENWNLICRLWGKGRNV